jgi:hypothetical protein
VSFNTILDEYIVAHCVEYNIFSYSQVFIAMNCEGSIERGMYSITLGIGFMDGSNKMEMDWVSSHLECLTNLGEFCVR